MPCVIHRPYPLTQAGFARIRFAAFEKTPHGGPYGMPGMAITFILITLLPSPFCQLLFSYLTHNSSLSSALVHSVMMRFQMVFLMLSVCFSMFSSSHFPHPNSTKKSGCFKVNDCKCIMKDGSGVINLKTMGDADGFLGRLKPVSAEDMPVSAEVLLTFSPCQPFSQPEDLTGADCTNVAACLTVRQSRQDSQFMSMYLNRPVEPLLQSKTLVCLGPDL